MSYLFSNTFVPKNTDSFGRTRVSEPFTLFDSSHRFRDNRLWSSSITGGASASFNTNQGLMDLTIETNSGDQVIRETEKVFAYQPGKSLLVLNSFVFNPPKSGLRQRVGYFGTENGFYLEQTDSTINLVKRTLVSGVSTNIEIEKSTWNFDKLDGTGPSGIVLDLTKVQILWMDYEWLGSGCVRCGFVIDDDFHICHKFHHANIIDSTYITTACLPLRYEITNTSSTLSASKLKQICSTVLSEGGYELRGEAHSIGVPINVPITLTTPGVFYPVVSLRLKSSKLDGVVIPTGMSCLAKDSGNYMWKLIESGTTYNGTWSTLGTNSVVEYNIIGGSFSGGDTIHSGLFTSTNQGSAPSGLSREGLFDHQLRRNTFTGQSYEFTLCIAAEVVGGGGSKVWGIIDWEEITK